MQSINSFCSYKKISKKINKSELTGLKKQPSALNLTSDAKGQGPTASLKVPAT
jgi:hypothetical protein